MKYVNSYNVKVILLIFFIIEGIIGKFLISINCSLSSDGVIPGIVSLEIWRHKDYLLSQFSFSSAAPNIFSDIFPFQLIPQIISNFDPYAIRIMAFIIFLLIIFTFSCLIYKINGDILNGLIFAALLANLWLGSFRYFSEPQSHNGTMFFVGIFLLLFLKTREINLSRTWIFLIFLLNLIVFSDSIIVAWFVIPFTAIYILFFEDKTLKSNLSILVMNLTTLITYVIKTVFISTLVTSPIYIKDITTIFDVNIPLYIKGLLYLLNGSVYSIYETPTPSDCIIIFSFILLLYYSGRYIMLTQNRYSKILYSFFIISASIIFLGYVCTNLSIDFSTARYLTLTALSIYVLISLSYNNNNKIFILLIFLVLFSSAISNYTYIKNLDYQPNQPQLELIEYLKDNGLQYGIGDYWDSNIITYLSKEQVIVRPVFAYDGEILSRKWFSSDRWVSEFLDKSKNLNKFFIIFGANDTLKLNELRSFLAHNPPIEIKSYGNYKIYVYNQVV